MLGLDITEIPRMERAVKSAHFVCRVFTPGERAYYESTGRRAETLAGLFSAKEAVAKALGTGFRGFALTDIEILHDGAGKPYAVLFGEAKRLLQGRGLELSITHAGGVAAAVCLIL